MNEALAPLQSIDASAALQSFLASGVVLTCVVLCGLAGLRTGFFRSVLAFAAFIAAGVAAFVWCDAMGSLIRGFGGPADWSLVLGYTTVFLLAFVILTLVLRGVARAEVMTYPAIIDRLGGLLVGVLAGVLMASIVRVGFAMTPVPAAVRPTPEQIQFDATPRVLRMVSRILSADPAVRSVWLHGEQGEPFEGQAKPGQVVLSEPYIDLNDNEQFDRDEPFLDKDGDGRFTSTLIVADEERGRDLRVGVMERYWLGDWQRVKVSLRNPGAGGNRDAAPGN